MPQERLPVRKIKEVLRLHSLGLSQRQIAASCAVGQATISDYLKAAEVAGLKWPDVAEWSDDRVMQAVAPARRKPDHRSQSPEPDYADIRHELQKQTRHLAAFVGGVPGEDAGRLPVQPILRSISEMAGQTRICSATGASRG